MSSRSRPARYAISDQRGRDLEIDPPHQTHAKILLDLAHHLQVALQVFTISERDMEQVGRLQAVTFVHGLQGLVYRQVTSDEKDRVPSMQRIGRQSRERLFQQMLQPVVIECQGHATFLSFPGYWVSCSKAEIRSCLNLPRPGVRSPQTTPWKDSARHRPAGSPRSSCRQIHPAGPAGPRPPRPHRRRCRPADLLPWPDAWRTRSPRRWIPARPGRRRTGRGCRG